MIAPKTRAQGQPLHAALLVLGAPFFLGLAPIFGKLALRAGADPFTVAALRTVVAVALLWAVYALAFRRYITIYPAGLIGCVVVGVVNGVGSLFYYSGLGLLDASTAQLLNGMYLVFALLLAGWGLDRVTPRTFLRVGLALVALLLITGWGGQEVTWLGVGLMLASALMFAGTLVLSQWVLYEMPAPTATLYILSTMAVVVCMAWYPVRAPLDAPTVGSALAPIGWLGVTTALARLTLFGGVKLFGSLQTAVLAVLELAVALVLAFVVLGDRLLPTQWVGVGLLVTTLLLVRSSDLLPRGLNPNALLVANMASVQFQRIAFHRAFGTRDLDDTRGTMAALTTAEIKGIRAMMGVQNVPVNPFPIAALRRGLREHDGGYEVDLDVFLRDYDERPTKPRRPSSGPTDANDSPNPR